MLLKPRYVALDSSHLGQWLTDRTSRSPGARSQAGEFEARLLGQGFVLVLCMHHLQELLQHENVGVVTTRLRALSSLPFIGWIASTADGLGLGTIVDILTEEVRSAAANPSATAAEVRDGARPGLLKTGAAVDALGTRPEEWLKLRPFIKEMEERSRVIVGITRSDTIDVGGKTFAELRAGALRNPHEIKRLLTLMANSLASDIAKRGDRRLTSPQAVAAEFIAEVEQAASGEASVESLIAKCLALQGVSPDEVTPEMTVDEVGTLGVFRTRLALVAERVGRPPAELVRLVKPECVPSWIIPQALQRFGQDPTERLGSELIDLDLVCLSPYVDVVFVDKRTKENVVRASRHAPESMHLAGRIEKASSYTAIPSILDAGTRNVRHAVPGRAAG